MFSNQPPPPIVSFTPEGVRQGLCHLASYGAGYVRLGALKAIGQILGLFPGRASGQHTQPDALSGNAFGGFDYRPAVADSQAVQQAVAQQAAEAQQAEAETEAEDAQPHDETNAEDDEDQGAAQEDEPP